MGRTTGLLGLCAGLAGCEEGTYASTRVESLQIVSMVAEPTEVAPHGETELTVTIADPAGAGAEVAVWMCTPVGDARRCLEAEALGDAQPVQVGVRDPDSHAVRWRVTPLPIDVAEVDELLAGGEVFRGVLAFALACTPGVCDFFDDVADGTVRAEQLADPDVLLAGVPMAHAHLAWRAMTLSLASPAERHPNPTIAPRFPTPVRAPAGGTRDLGFEVDGIFSDGLVYPLATLGGFAQEYASTGPAEPTVQWVAPEAASGTTGHIYAVVDDGQGGQAVWFGPAEVE